MILFDAILNLARTIGVVREGVATSGSTTTLGDTLHKYTTGTFPGGTLFFLTGDNINHTRLIVGYTGSIFTFSPATDNIPPVPPAVLPTAQPIEVGDLFAIVDRDFPRDLLVQAVNSALMQQYPLVEEVIDPLLITVASQEDYTVAAKKVLRVEVASDTATPFGYVKHFHWEQYGTTLHFDSAYVPATAGYLFRITYEAPYVALIDDDDTINQAINTKILHWQSVAELCRTGLKLYRDGEERQLTNILNEAYGQLQRMQAPFKPQRDPHLAGW